VASHKAAVERTTKERDQRAEEVRRLRLRVATQGARTGELEATLQIRDGELASLTQTVAERDTQVADLKDRVKQLDGALASSQEDLGHRVKELDQRAGEIKKLRQQVTRLETHLSIVYASTSWRITGPMRAVSDRLRLRAVRRNLRRGLKLGGWLATGQFGRAANGLLPYYHRHMPLRLKALVPDRVRRAVKWRLVPSAVRSPVHTSPSVRKEVPTAPEGHGRPLEDEKKPTYKLPSPNLASPMVSHGVCGTDGTVSMIVLNRDRAELLDRLLASVHDIRSPVLREIIVVDHASSHEGKAGSIALDVPLLPKDMRWRGPRYKDMEEKPVCNLCGSTTFTAMNNRPRAKCESCGSLERTRLLHLYLEKLELPQPGMKVLHFAPEKGLYDVISKVVNIADYMTADIDPGRFKFAKNIVKFDICTDVETLPENCFDLIIHSHVLEHVKCNFAYVLFHLHRALKEDGRHICVIPFLGGSYDECFGNIGREEATRRFGQFDHVRRFGRDDIDMSLGKILDFDRDFDATRDFPPESLLKCNIPETSWHGLNPDTVLCLRKYDMRLLDLRQRARSLYQGEATEGRHTSPLGNVADRHPTDVASSPHELVVSHGKPALAPTRFHPSDLCSSGELDEGGQLRLNAKTVGWQQLVFICGVGRSGTTALAELLNSHPLVCIGIERFKYLNLRKRNFSAELFHKDRFFEFRPDDTNIIPNNENNWARMYSSMKEKYDNAKVVGDKIPDLFLAIDNINSGCEGAKFIYIVRDIDRVAASWNARAMNAADRWPESNDFRAAVDMWNRANQIILKKLHELPEQICVVSYERFFSGDVMELDRLCSFLDISRDPNLETKYFEACQHYLTNLVQKEPMVLAGQREFIEQNADFDSYKDLMTFSVGL